MDIEKIYLIIESTPLLIALLFSLFFYLKNESNSNSNKFLGLLFLAFVAIQSFTVFTNFLDNQFGKLLIPVIIGGALIIPPTIYGYVNSLTLKKENINVLKHYIIGITIFLINLLVFSLLILLDKESNIIKFLFSTFEIIQIGPLDILALGPLAVLFPLMSIYYIYLSFQSIRKHQSDIKDVYSYQEGINLQWLKIFLIGFICFFILVFYSSLSNSLADDKETFLQKTGFDFITLVYIIFIGIKALQQSTISSTLLASQESIKEEIIEEDSAIIENETDQSKYKEIKIRLEECMSSNQPYIETSLSIYDLAKMIDTNYKYLSKTIKQEFNQNFVSYINSYRVEEAMNLLKNSKYNNYTIEALAEMSGFKSKSAFNTAFKKLVGATPSEFKNR